MAAPMTRQVLAKITSINTFRWTCPCNRSLLVARTCSSNPALNRPKEGSTESDDEFRVFIIPGHNDVQESKKTKFRARKAVPPARYQTMKTDQDWTNVWPAAETFKWSVVPFPVRQGMVVGEENKGIPPKKYANAELMKIPNFLHLTPHHIKKQCAAIKEFCTPWPEGLETDEAVEKHFPVTVITSDYLVDSPSVRDARARTVTVKMKLSSLPLDYHARDKMLRLVGDRYNPATDEITVVTDRCPTRKQNYDYTMYMLTVLYQEAWKTEPWESEKTLEDMESYVWDINQSRNSTMATLQGMIKAQDGESPKPGFLSTVEESSPEDDIIQISEVADYGHSVETIHNDGENPQTLKKYKDSVTKMLFPNK